MVGWEGGGGLKETWEGNGRRRDAKPEKKAPNIPQVSSSKHHTLHLAARISYVAEGDGVCHVTVGPTVPIIGRA